MRRPFLMRGDGQSGMEITDSSESLASMNSRQALLPAERKAPRGKKASLFLQPLDEQNREQFRLYPGASGSLVVLRHVAGLHERLQPLEGEFDLPSSTVELQYGFRVEDRVANGGQDKDIFRRLQSLRRNLLPFFRRHPQYPLFGSLCGYRALADRA